METYVNEIIIVVRFHIIILYQVFSLRYWNSYIICVHCSISHNYIMIKSFHWDIEILNSSLGMTISFRGRCSAMTQLVSLWVSWCFEPSPRHMSLEHVPNSLCSAKIYNSTGKCKGGGGGGEALAIFADGGDCDVREAWKEEALDDLRWKDETRGPSSARRTVSKATLGKLPRDGVERIWAFPST